MRRGEAKGFLTLGRLLGVPFRLHISMAFAVPLLGLGFTSYFHSLAVKHGAALPSCVWGILITVALLASVVLHEVAHAWVALRHGAPVRAITLLFLGGSTDIGGEPPRPRSEALMAFAGPVTSLLLGGALLLASLALQPLASAPDLRAAVGLLGLINVILGGFNLLPAMPLDGGRVFRAILTLRLGRARATRWAVTCGKVVAFVMVLFAIQHRDPFTGVLAFCLFVGAVKEGMAVDTEDSARGLLAADAMSPVALAVPGGLTVTETAVEMQRARTEATAILDPAGRPLGAITAAELKTVAPSRRPSMTLADILHDGQGTVSHRTPLQVCLTRLRELRASALAVVDDQGNLAGILRPADADRLVLLRQLAYVKPAPTPALEPQTNVSHSG